MDQTIFHLINERWTNPVLDLFMAALSDSEIWKPLLILIALCVLIFAGFKGRAWLLCLLFSLVIAQQVTSLLKSAIDRHRPKQVETLRIIGSLGLLWRWAAPKWAPKTYASHPSLIVDPSQ